MRSRTLVATVLAVLVVGCGGGPSVTASKGSATPEATIAATGMPSPTATACTAGDVLRQTDRLLAGETFDAHYLTIAGRMTLSVWLVAPEIDPAATQASLASNNRKALERGLLTFARIVEAAPCTTSVFEQLNPMIVDAEYEGWYIDFLPARAFAGLHDPSVDQIVTALERTGKAVAAGRPAPANQPTAAGATCDWTAASAKVRPMLGPATGNAAAYVIVGARLSENRWDPNPPDDVNVEVQWTATAPPETTDATILDRLGRVAAELACLRTPVDLLEAFVVDGTGRLIVYAKVPGPTVRSGKIPLPGDAVVFVRQNPGSP